MCMKVLRCRGRVVSFKTASTSQRELIGTKFIKCQNTSLLVRNHYCTAYDQSEVLNTQQICRKCLSLMFTFSFKEKPPSSLWADCWHTGAGTLVLAHWWVPASDSPQLQAPFSMQHLLLFIFLLTGFQQVFQMALKLIIPQPQPPETLL